MWVGVVQRDEVDSFHDPMMLARPNVAHQRHLSAVGLVQGAVISPVKVLLPDFLRQEVLPWTHEVVL